MPPLRQIKWKPPDCGKYKKNYNRAVFGDVNEAELGVLIWNDKGGVMAALAKKIPLPHSVVLLEALAMRQAVLFATELGFNQFVFEGDSKILVKALYNASSSHAAIGHIIKDIQSTSSFFQTHSFSHTRRQGNSIAHVLARRARNSFPLDVWMESIPSDLVHLVIFDFHVP